jgi:hypothetical protein
MKPDNEKIKKKLPQIIVKVKENLEKRRQRSPESGIR